MRVALDTNILVYAEGVDGSARQVATLDLIDRLDADGITLPVQVLGELCNVLVRKARRSPAEARDRIAAWQESYTVVPTTGAVLEAAMELVQQRHLAIWDAVILAAAAEAGCEVLLTEDMHHGFAWRGMVLRNPCATNR
ncbi:PIN domain-containing protein [Siccirubricoccus sp. KC 17139]|uniref:Ribonuclease VapC n=1 Tax=Siccirubricoccus soli TaxID=2899147 RepID=A0ABT1DB24_9PROT|nr:PIN domain-containing protein [Siccirubricoccus soli]MCP2685278.1 PIN domain-containing protein [Siccirubricoccus soli]